MDTTQAPLDTAFYSNAPAGSPPGTVGPGYNELATPVPFVGANTKQFYVGYGAAGAYAYTFKLGSQVVAQDFLIGDQAVRTTTYISGRCMNAAGTALEPCDLSQAATYNEYLPNAPIPYCGEIRTSWHASTHELQASTPIGCNGASTQGRKLYLKLPASLRWITARSTNGGGPDFNIRGLAVADAPSVSKSFSPASVMTDTVSTLTISIKNPIVPASTVPNVNLTDVLPSPLELAAMPTTTCTGGTLTGAAGTNTISLTGTTLPAGGCTITAQVRWPGTAAGLAACKPGTPLVNTITPPSQFSTAFGQLETPATASLDCIVTGTPSITKAFAPAAVKPGELSTLTLTLANPTVPATAVSDVHVTDALPAPLELVGGATTTCTGGTLTADAGGNTLSLSGATLPATTGCTITAQVRWPGNDAGVAACKPGTPLVNTITAPGQFSTALGQADTPATANLDCSPVPPVVSTPQPVPTQSPAGLALLVAACGVLGWRVRRRIKG